METPLFSCVVSGGKQPVSAEQREALSDEDVTSSVHSCSEVILGTFHTDSTAPQAETEDLSVADDDDDDKSVTSSSSGRQTELMTTFDLSTATVRVLTLSGSQSGTFDVPGPAEHFGSDDECRDSVSCARVQNDASGHDRCDVADSNLQDTISCSDETGRSSVNTSNNNCTSAASSGGANDSQQTPCAGDSVISSVNVMAGISTNDYCPRDYSEVDEVVCRQTSGVCNTTAVCGYASRLCSTSTESVCTDDVDSEGCVEYDKRGGDTHRLVGLSRAAAAASRVRYVTRLFVTLAARPRFRQTPPPSCSGDDEDRLVVDVSNDVRTLSASVFTALRRLLCLYACTM